MVYNRFFFGFTIAKPSEDFMMTIDCKTGFTTLKPQKKNGRHYDRKTKRFYDDSSRVSTIVVHTSTTTNTTSLGPNQ